MKKVIIDIQSMSDIITNSSTEVFVLNADNSGLEELIQALAPNFKSWFEIFKTEDDVKKYLLERLNEYESYELRDFDEYLDWNPLYNIVDSYAFGDWMPNMTKYGMTKEKLVDFFFEPYKALVGKAILSFDDDCRVPDEIWDFTNAAKKNNIVLSFNRR